MTIKILFVDVIQKDKNLYYICYIFLKLLYLLQYENTKYILSITIILIKISKTIVHNLYGLAQLDEQTDGVVRRKF